MADSESIVDDRKVVYMANEAIKALLMLAMFGVLGAVLYYPRMARAKRESSASCGVRTAVAHDAEVSCQT
jgi:cyanate permease